VRNSLGLLCDLIDFLLNQLENLPALNAGVLGSPAQIKPKNAVRPPIAASAPDVAESFRTVNQRRTLHRAERTDDSMFIESSLVIFR